MLLCCFKDVKTSEEEAYNLAKSDSKVTQKSRNSVQSDSVSVTSLKNNQYYKKERAPLNKEEKRLIKQQRSRESIKSSRSFSQNNNNIQNENFPYIDQGEASPGKEDGFQSYGSLSSGVTSSPSRSFDADNGQTHSTPISPVHKSNNVPQSRSMQFPVSNGNSVILRQQPNVRTSIQKEQESSQRQSTGSRGMTRSSASYGIQQMLQEQILIEEQAKKEDEVTQKYEALISDLKRKHNQEIQQKEESHKTALNNTRNNLQSELRTTRCNHVMELQKLERKHEAALKEVEQSWQKILQQKELEFSNVIDEYEKKDQEWQLEKQDVLSEIQRLKEEANRFIAILAAEEQDDDSNLSPQKKQNLTREVESLQLVVEMRTQEIHRLRDERSKHLARLEDLEQTKISLDKMKAKVEDLEVQLQRKSELERQLSLEKSNLENCYDLESKEKERVSMQVEQLQWRLRNNKELPPTSITLANSNNNPFATNSILNSKERPDSLPQGLKTVWHQQQNKQVDEEIVTLRKTITNSQNNCQVTPNNNTSTTSGTTWNSTNIDNNNKLQAIQNGVSSSPETSNFSSTSSDDGGGGSNLSHVDSLQSLEKLTPDQDDAGYGGLSDEGLGDICSNSSASPQPLSILEQKDESSGCQKIQEEIVIESKNENNSKKDFVLHSPADERMPSRIALSVTTTKV